MSDAAVRKQHTPKIGHDTIPAPGTCTIGREPGLDREARWNPLWEEGGALRLVI
jgi:hypothetical protein